MSSRGGFWSKMNFHRHRQENGQNGAESAPAQPTPPPVPIESKPVSKAVAQPQVTHVNPFAAISNEPPVIPMRPDHPVPRTSIRTRSGNNLGSTPTTPLHTNKFYANFYLEDQSMSTWTQPYSLWWSKGRG
jgi:endo-1,3(4)-beta-glucanase